MFNKMGIKSYIDAGHLDDYSVNEKSLDKSFVTPLEDKEHHSEFDEIIFEKNLLIEELKNYSELMITKYQDAVAKYSIEVFIF
jgi:hypothetical protein